MTLTSIRFHSQSANSDILKLVSSQKHRIVWIPPIATSKETTSTNDRLLKQKQME